MALEKARFSYSELHEIAEQIHYKDWLLLIRNIDPYTSMLWWNFMDNGEPQHCRMWVVDHNQPISDVVRTALFAAITAEEHEVREKFTYKGKKIFGPHFDVNKLAELAGKKENLEIP